MPDVYTPVSPTAEKEYISTNGESLIQLVTDEQTGETITNSFYMKNDNDTPPTGFDIFKNPDLWICILAVLLTLMIAGPIKIINVRRRRRKLFSPDDDVFNDNLFIKEGFIC
ncbi:MAG: hypothetical protein Q4F54_01155 [Coriobacteriia bacterium]|nr:hypothetical protein [Coriobacteriia bacterium]